VTGSAERPSWPSRSAVLAVVGLAAGLTLATWFASLHWDSSTLVAGRNALAKLTLVLGLMWSAWPQVTWIAHRPGSAPVVAIGLIMLVLIAIRPRLIVILAPIFFAMASLLLTLGRWQRPPGR
jgi:hypothetical protein